MGKGKRIKEEHLKKPMCKDSSATNDSDDDELNEDSLSTAFSTDIRPFIDVIDALRRFGIQEDIPLPNVVVVGDQSSGKSSIIEALSGVQLPRGKGIVTRCPLELQLKRVLDATAWVAKLSYKSKEGDRVEISISAPTDVEEYIRQAQDNICGKGKGVSNELITLRIESPAVNAPDLTLIDLPGIARIALADQAYDICDQIKETIMGYVKPANTVILCVISAFLDIAVNESINIATKVDRHGERTIGVITKPDLADESQKNEVLYILNNERIHLAKGYSMVKCRSQKELDENVTLEISTIKETEFFQNDEIYSYANKNQLGVMNLATKISEELVNVIKNSLPQLKNSIDTALQSSQTKLDHLPGGVPESVHDKRTYLSKHIWNLNAEIKRFLNDGVNKNQTENMFLKWRKLSATFCEAVIEKNDDAVSIKLSLDNLTELIAQSRGREISFFFNFELFESLVTALIKTYEDDARVLAKDANTLIEASIMTLIEESLRHLPKIDRELKSILKQESMNCLERSFRKIEFVFKQETFAFTMDCNFEKELESLQKKEMESQKLNGKSNDKFMADFNRGSAKSMHDMIIIYLKIVAQRLCDVIPMTVHHCSMIFLCDALHESFLSYATSTGVEDKISENRVVHEERRKLVEKIERLRMAQMELIKF